MLVLTDVEMPEMNGFELAQQIQQKFPELHVVAVTAEVNAEVEEQAKQAGVAAIMSKPVAEDKVMQLVAELSS